MYKLLFLFTAIAISCNVSAQTTQDEINEHIWFPFMETYNSYDTDGFMAIHTDDVLRINREGKDIRIGEEYAKQMEMSNTRSKESGSTREIDFSFLERIDKGDTAFEVGYYRVKYSHAGGSGVSFGKFQVILKRVDGKWKIAVDSDTSHGGTVSLADFESGNVLKQGE